ncbi:hypothetical protein [uncultured Megasphaera sp.]|uniref:hypothetical protein n=1 Tax=uncultured Megasphaera sp. TaxID=165188 RepID=UPI00265946F6|nr:hypothetical protein [uncultured Megasphaera sp.]
MAESTIQLIAKIKQKNNGTFKLMDAADVAWSASEGLVEHINGLTINGGNADTAAKLAAARAIGIGGAVTAAGVGFDGSQDITIIATSVDATKLTGVVPGASLPSEITVLPSYFDGDSVKKFGGHTAGYYATADQLQAVTSGMTWRPPVADLAALKAITTPVEGWTTSLIDTNMIYRFDAANEATKTNADATIVKADDGTAGAWIAIGSAQYGPATQTANGLMSAADKKKLDGIDLSQYQPKIGDTLDVANVHLMGADSGIQLGGMAGAQLHGKEGKIYYGEGTDATNTPGNELAKKSDIPAAQDLSAYAKYNAEKDINLADHQLSVNGGGLVKNVAVTTGEGEQAKTTNYLFLGNSVTTGEGEAAVTTNEGIFVSGGKAYYGGQAAGNEVATVGAVGNKVDKVNGKGLSTNDFTAAYKTKLDGLSNYVLPAASTETLGGVKAGTGVTIAEDGTISADIGTQIVPITNDQIDALFAAADK